MTLLTSRDLNVRVTANTSQYESALHRSGRQTTGWSQRNEQSLRRTALALAGVATAGVAMGTSIARTGAEFQASMNQVRAVSGATGREFGDLSEMAKELGATTRFSASEAAGGLGFLSMAGFDAVQSLEALPGVLQLAAAGNLDLGRAADIASNILTGYGMTADEIARVNDVMAKTFTSANTDLSQLGEAMKFVAPVASGAGVEFEEASAAIGLMGDAGIQGSMAGTSLRMALTQLLNPTGQAADAIERLGVETLDAEGNLLPLHEIVRELEHAGADTADMMQIFGQRAGPGMASLVARGSDTLQDFTQDLRDSGGTAEEIAGIQMEGLRGSLLELRSAFEGLQIGLFEAGLGDMAETAVDSLSRVVRWVDNLDDSTKSGLVNVGAFATGVSGIGATASLAIIAVSNLRTAMSTLGIKAGPVGFAIAAVGLAVGFFMSEAAKAEQVSQSLREELERVGGEFDRISTAFITGELREAGVLDTFNELGFSVADVKEAMAGNAEIAAELRGEISMLNEGLGVGILQHLGVGDSIREHGKEGRELGDVLALLIDEAEAEAVAMEGVERANERAAREAESARLGFDGMVGALGETTQQALTVPEQLLAVRDGSVAAGDAAEDAAFGFDDFSDSMGDAEGQARSLGSQLDDEASSLPALDAALGRSEDAVKDLTSAQSDLHAGVMGFHDPVGVYKQLLSEKEEAERAAAQATADATEDSSKSWEDFFGDVDISMGEMIDGLEEQQAALEEWEANIATIASTGRTDFAAELAAMGPEGADIVKQVADNHTSPEFERLADLWIASTERGGIESTAAMERNLIAQSVIAGIQSGETVDALTEQFGIGAREVHEIFQEYRRSMIDNLNPLLEQTGHTKITNPHIRPPEFAQGGPIPGARTGKDDVPIMAMAGEYMQPVPAVSYYGLDAMEKIRTRQIPREVFERGQRFAEGGPITKAKMFAAAQAGKRYQIPGVGPSTYDCSGLVAAVQNVLMGRNPHSRLYSTSSFAGNPANVAGLQRGLGTYGVGVSTAAQLGARRYGHMSATLAGMDLEATPPRVRIGGPARGADDPMYRMHYHLPEVGGVFIGGGPGGMGALEHLLPKPPEDWPHNGIGKSGPAAARHMYDSTVSMSLWDIPTSGGGGDSIPAGRERYHTMMMDIARERGWMQHANAWADLIGKESSWNPRAQNPTSTAFGLGQFLDSTWATVGMQKTSDPHLQLVAMGRYIAQRYGDPSAALAFWKRQDPHWYGDGGFFESPQVIGVGEAGPEFALPEARLQDLVRQSADQALTQFSGTAVPDPGRLPGRDDGSDGGGGLSDLQQELREVLELIERINDQDDISDDEREKLRILEDQRRELEEQIRAREDAIRELERELDVIAGIREEFRLEGLSDEDLVDELRDQLAELQPFSEEWRRVYRDLERAEEQLIRAREEAWRDAERIRDDAMRDLERMLEEEQRIHDQIGGAEERAQQDREQAEERFRDRREQLVEQREQRISDLQQRAEQQRAQARERRDQQILAAEERFADQREQLLARREQQLLSGMDPTQRLQSGMGASAGALTENILGQAGQFDEWQAGLAELRAQGLSEEVIAALGLEVGPQALGQVRMLLDATTGELDELNEAMELRHTQAAEHVAGEAENLVGQVGQDLLDLHEQLGEGIADAHDTYREAITNINTDLQEGVQEAHDQFREGMEAARDELAESLERISEQLENRLEELHEELEQIGEDTGLDYGEAIERGINSSIPAVREAARRLQDAIAEERELREELERERDQRTGPPSQDNIPAKFRDGEVFQDEHGHYWLRSHHGLWMRATGPGQVKGITALYGSAKPIRRDQIGDEHNTVEGWFGGPGELEKIVAMMQADQGGILPPGLSAVWNRTGQPEMIFPRPVLHAAVAEAFDQTLPRLLPARVGAGGDMVAELKAALGQIRIESVDVDARVFVGDTELRDVVRVEADARIDADRREQISVERMWGAHVQPVTR